MKKEKVEKKIVPGAVVALAGDTQRKMTVESLNILADVANVVWFDDGGRLYKASVPAKALKLV